MASAVGFFVGEAKLTAEIAILNKTAVALAADSAVTISSGSQNPSETKVYHNGDKLFELCDTNPIGIMIYSNAEFMGIPLPVIIRDFRYKCKDFEKVEDAAKAFLRYLYEVGEQSPVEMKRNAIFSEIYPALKILARRSQEKFVEKINSFEGDLSNVIVDEMRDAALDEEIDVLNGLLENTEDSDIFGGENFDFGDAEAGVVNDLIAAHFENFSDDRKEAIRGLSQKLMRKSNIGEVRTGVVIAGFGSKEIFPSLFSYEISGMIGGVLKYSKDIDVDIDRRGARAAVLPFAQKEMVERFLYGLDAQTRQRIAGVIRSTLPDLQNSILERIEFESPDDEAELKRFSEQLQERFLDELGNSAFDVLQTDSRKEIESMVEFMPKADLAQMAEALVELTSIKRRVSVGIETVSPPIDVAIISRSEGFVWVKRKHYFPAELNARYFQRLKDGRVSPDVAAKEK